MQSLKAPLLPSLTSVTFSYHVNLPVNVSVNLQKFLFFLSPFFPSFPLFLSLWDLSLVFLLFLKKVCIYLTELGLSFSTWTL